MRKPASALLLFAATLAFWSQGAPARARNIVTPRPPAKLPDLVFAGVEHLKWPSKVGVTVKNAGDAKAGPYKMAFICQNGQAEVAMLTQETEMAAGSARYVVLDCGKLKILRAGLDAKNEVRESNEANNKIAFEGQNRLR
ncbi:MAG: CARDB domain-containing protein [Pyrinomonadaceae bacterium]